MCQKNVFINDETQETPEITPLQEGDGHTLSLFFSCGRCCCTKAIGFKSALLILRAGLCCPPFRRHNVTLTLCHNSN